MFGSGISLETLHQCLNSIEPVDPAGLILWVQAGNNFPLLKIPENMSQILKGHRGC